MVRMMLFPFPTSTCLTDPFSLIPAPVGRCVDGGWGWGGSGILWEACLWGFLKCLILQKQNTSQGLYTLFGQRVRKGAHLQMLLQAP